MTWIISRTRNSAATLKALARRLVDMARESARWIA